MHPGGAGVLTASLGLAQGWLQCATRVNLSYDHDTIPYRDPHGVAPDSEYVSEKVSKLLKHSPYLLIHPKDDLNYVKYAYRSS